MIKIENLNKEFKVKKEKVLAVDDISFTINQGESVAFIGPNGAGKSTTIKILTGILHPTSGVVNVLGLSPQENRKKVVSQIGAVFGQRSQLLPNLPAYDTFRLFGSMYGLNKKEIDERVIFLEKELNLSEFINRPIRTLSLGQRMRVEIACALIHKPKILFLDEPSIGLDILAKQALRETLIRLRDDHNVTIFLTSHDVGDIDIVCDRTIIVNHGKIILDKPTNEIRTLISKERKIKIEDIFDENIINEEGVTCIKDKGSLIFSINTEKSKVSNILDQIIKTGYEGEIEVLPPSLEDVISTFYV